MTLIKLLFVLQGQIQTCQKGVNGVPHLFWL